MLLFEIRCRHISCIFTWWTKQWLLADCLEKEDLDGETKYMRVDKTLIYESHKTSWFYDPSLSNIWFLISHWKLNKFLHALVVPFFFSLICPSFQIRISTHNDDSLYPASGGINPLGMPSFRILSVICPSLPESMKLTSKATE